MFAIAFDLVVADAKTERLIMEKSWLNQDLPRKKVKKYAEMLTEIEVRGVVDFARRRRA